MKSIFVETLGDSPQVKVLDFLIDNYDRGWTLVEIKNGTNSGYSTLKQLLPILLNRKIVAIDKKISKAKLYKINLKNDAVKHLLAFDWSMVKNAK